MSHWSQWLGLVALGVMAPGLGRAAGTGSLGVYWVDVEGGGATLIVTPAGESVLIDTGLDNPRDPARIARVAKDVARLTQIDHLVVTHFDIDHHGGAAELSKLIPIRRVYDPGDEIGQAEPMYVKYVAWRKTVPYTVLKAGDAMPLREAEGTARIGLTCLAAAQQFLAAGPEHKPNPIPASEAPEYPEDRSENRQSIVLLLRFGEFEFYDGADLTGRLEAKFALPVNLVGEVDIYQVTHHGLDISNNPVLVRSLAPTVTVMNNGERKGCGPKTRAALKATTSIQANYQLHKNLAPNADNTPDELIANLGPGADCKGNHIELHVAPDGAAHAAETVLLVAEAHVGQGGRLAVPCGRAARVGTRAPAPAADDTLGAARRAARVLSSAARVIILGVDVVAPFGGIAVHVHEAPGIGRHLPHGARGAASVVGEPGELA